MPDPIVIRPGRILILDSDPVRSTWGRLLHTRVQWWWRYDRGSTFFISFNFYWTYKPWSFIPAT